MTDQPYVTETTNREGERVRIANFVATITHEIRYVDDGTTTETQFTIAGKQPNLEDSTGPPDELPSISMSADEFSTMQWPLRRWGARAVVFPVPGAKEDLRTEIQITSRPIVTIIHRHLGWTRINNEPYYLHAGGAIGPNGNDPSIQVAVPPEFRAYNLTPAGRKVKPEDGFAATFGLLTLAPPELMWPLLAATFAPLYGPIDFAVHLAGRTGTFKSELTSLLAAHYGSTIDARHLPGSWSSTPNALEAQAHIAKNAVFPIDDFVPSGTSWQVKAYQTTADKIIRAQGNQAGRARLNDTSKLQSTNYPRGLILSTGEDIPEGHSVRARCLILEISPGNIETKDLSAAQANRQKFHATTRHIVESLAKKPRDISKRAKTLRDSTLGTGHNRTPSMLGRLQATIEDVLALATKLGIITAQAAKDDATQAWTAICNAGQNQMQYLEATDPVELFLTSLRQLMAQGMGHCRKMNGGVPGKPEMLGWSGDGDQPFQRYKSHGPCIGWVDWDANELCLDLAVGFPLVRKVAGNDLAISKPTLTKRLKETGKLTRADNTRQRNTVRITAEDHPRLVVCVRLDSVLLTQEMPQ